VAQKITGAIPDQLDLVSAWQINIVAVNPSTGAAVSGVTFSNMALVVDTLMPDTVEALAVGPFMLVPGPAA
jgi:hypothetical protein